MTSTTLNPSADAPYFTPRHAHTPGAPYEIDETTPTLFKPLNIRNVTLRNRIMVAPMCQYSTAPSGPEIGQLTDYHIAHLGHYALKGAALVMIEATAVQPNGRISPNCPGIWEDAQIAPIKRVSDFIRSQGALSSIQLAHAGRKASVTAPWVAARYRKDRGWSRSGAVRSAKDVGGWPDDVVGPMGGVGECWDGLGLADEGGFWPSRALTEEEIQEVVRDFGKAAARAVKAGIDVVEIHSAHGYLLHQFLSPVTNRRTDKYGGSFEGRTRLLREVIAEVRNNIPAETPLFLRVSCTDWLEDTDVEKKFGGSWDMDGTIQLAKLLPDLGVDLLDVSSGGNHPAQKSDLYSNEDYQVSRAARIRREVKATGKELLVGAVGLITKAERAKEIVQTPWDGADIKEEADAAKAITQNGDGTDPKADVILVGRQFLREPEWVLRVAWHLGVDVAWPSQFDRVRLP